MLRYWNDRNFFMLLIAPEKILLLFSIIFLIRFLLWTTLEHFFRMHTFNRCEVFLSDLTTMFFYMIVIFPLAQYSSNLIGIEGSFLSFLADLPLILRIILFFIIADFLHYWVHRLMHQTYLWRIHRWHHSLDHMSWMGGFRATVFDATLVNLAFIFAWPILGNISYTMIIFILLCNLLINDWMHLNVNFRLSFLEKIIITPRYHHVHHSNEKKHYMKNLSAIFPIWDKLFGTYVDPDTVDKKLMFGLDKKIKTPRLIIGL